MKSVVNKLNRFSANVIHQIRPKTTQFVPKHEPATEEDIARLATFLENKPNILVLTGAGISTESGLLIYLSKPIL